jgi:tetratricopeptide (TPR) repeat protein
LGEAITAFKEAIRLKPGYAEFYNNLGNALKAKGLVDEAITAYKKAIRLKPAFAYAYFDLGLALHNKGLLDEAVAAYKEAIHFKPDYAEAYNGLGNVLQNKRSLDKAIAAYKEAIRFEPSYPQAHYNLGVALQGKGLLNEAIAAYKEAIRLRRGCPEAHCNLGHALRDKGLFRQALEEFRRGHELGTKNPRWPYPSAQWIRNCEGLVELDDRLPTILSGQSQPADTTERLAFAQMCALPCKKRYTAATRLYGAAFAAEPKLVGAQPSVHRYNAACNAALAGCGQGKDAENLNGKERARLRRQALAWLRADLAAWRKQLEKEPKKARGVLAGQMQNWQKDTDFTGVRGDAALGKLPEAERRDWQKLWKEVEGLRRRASERQVFPQVKGDPQKP